MAEIASGLSWLRSSTARKHSKDVTPGAKLDLPPSDMKARGSTVLGLDQEVISKRGWQMQRRRKSQRSQNLQELQENWDSDAPAPVDPQLEEELHLRHARLEQLIEVNRALHNMLVKKKLAAVELEQKSKDLQSHLEAARTVQEPAQRSSADELEVALCKEQEKSQVIHEELDQKNLECEERVRELQEASRKLQEVNAGNRKVIKEQAMEIKERQKAIKDLQRHVNLVEGAESKEEDRLMPLLERQILLEANVSSESSRPQKRATEEYSDDLEQEIEDDESYAASETEKLSGLGGLAPIPASVTCSRPTSSRRTVASSVRGVAAGYRRLPGLNLERLLGVHKQVSPPTSTEPPG